MHSTLPKLDGGLTNLSPCSHKEADTRVFLHVQDAASEGFGKMKLRTVDTDAVVIGCALYVEIEGLQELWMDFGVEKGRRYYLIHKFGIDLGGRCKALIFFHAFTGCDQVSYLVWQNYSFENMEQVSCDSFG